MSNVPHDPARPVEEVHAVDGLRQVRNHLGLTIRQHVAIEAMKGILANPEKVHLEHVDVSESAIAQADSLLSKLVLS